MQSYIKTLVLLAVIILIFTSCSNLKEIKVSSKTKEIVKVNKEEVNEEVTMYIATDIHYLADSINDGGEAFVKMVESGDGRQLNYIDQLTEAFKYNIKQNKPEVLIISGDLTHNGEKESHKELAKKFREIEENGTEVFVVPGNHDINNPYAREFKGSKQMITQSVTQKEFEEIFYEYGFKEAKSRDSSTLSYLAEVKEDLWVLMLDTNSYNSNTVYPATNGKLSSETLEWIKEVGRLAEESGAEIFVAMHHNLYNHSELLYRGYTLDNANDVFEVFKEANINVVLSGHVHIQDIKSDETNSIYDIVTSGFIVYPIQYGILKYGKTGFLYSTNMVDVEKWAMDFNIENENLLNFNEYSKKYFYNKSVEKVYEELINKYRYSNDEAVAMAEIMGKLNVNYFGGTTYTISEDVLESKGYDLWLKNEESFLREYIKSMAETRDEYYNYFEIPKVR